jgi:hypothetical protein
MEKVSTMRFDNFAVVLQAIENGFVVGGRKNPEVEAGYSVYCKTYAEALWEVKDRLERAVEFVGEEIKEMV